MFTSSSQNIWLKPAAKESPQAEEKEFSFLSELYVFLNSTICHCYRHLAQVDRSNVERFMWLCIHIFDAGALIFFTTTIWDSFTANPLVTTLHDTIYPIKNIPFPAVTVCSNNRISRRAAEEMSKELSQQDAAEKNKDDEVLNSTVFLKDILYLGRMYDYEVDNEHLMVAFQQTLDKTMNDTKVYNFSSIIQRLTPKCEDILVKCFFKSKMYPCMLQYEMCETRTTPSGFCCSFNYVRPKDNHPKNYAYHNDIIGPDMGLILVLNSMSDDYFYNIYNMMGFHILIHNPHEYPNEQTGTAIQRFVEPGEEIFIRVDASSITSEKDILGYRTDKRQCLFADEKPAYGGKYTRSECLTNCKIRSVKALCDCVPFQLPVTATLINQPKICTLQHVSCLNKYKIKWSTIMSEMIEIEGLEREMEESLICPECYASCSDSKYRVITSQLPLVESKRRGFGLTNDIANVSDNVIVRVYFGQGETWQYKQDVQLYWFEIFSNIGGLCGVVGGFSLIGFTEIFYFIIKQIFLYMMRKFKVKINSRSLQIYP